MSRYTVVWTGSALDELAEVWLRAVDRNVVTAAAYSIDHSLRDNAPKQGGDLSEGLRSFRAPPLKVIFVVREDDRVVEVLRVQRI